MSAIFAGLFSVKFAPTPHPRNWAGEICGMAQRRAAAGNVGFKKIATVSLKWTPQ